MSKQSAAAVGGTVVSTFMLLSCGQSAKAPDSIVFTDAGSTTEARASLAAKAISPTDVTHSGTLASVIFVPLKTPAAIEVTNFGKRGVVMAVVQNARSPIFFIWSIEPFSANFTSFRGVEVKASAPISVTVAGRVILVTADDANAASPMATTVYSVSSSVKVAGITMSPL